MLEVWGKGSHCFLELNTGHEDRDLLQVDSASIRIELLHLGAIRCLIFSLGQFELLNWHLGEKGLCFVLDKVELLHFGLVDSHRVVLFHKPRFFFVLLPEGLGVAILVQLTVILVLVLNFSQVSLTALHRRELLLAHHGF